MDLMTEDTQASLLLCGRFAAEAAAEPLELSEYNQVARWLQRSNLRPKDLLASEHLEAVAHGTGLAHERLARLVGRGVQLGFAVEAWNRSGIWVVSRGDWEYPKRLRAHLRDKAPPVLFGVGERSLLVGGGLAIVGSRNLDGHAEEWARKAAEWGVAHKTPVVSGGARGVDQIATTAALEAGGTAIGVLADSLLRSSVSRGAREAIAEGRLLLISPYHPEAGFNVGAAMGRNKLIYAMADLALVISAEHEKGGTWAGAVEELKREGRRPVFVRLDRSAPTGNHKLIDLGATALSELRADLDPRSFLPAMREASRVSGPAADLPLFAGSVENSEPTKPPEDTLGKASKPDLPASVYDSVLPLILDRLSRPSTAEELAARLDVSKAQMLAWLQRAVGERRVRKLRKPVRYVAGDI